MVEWYRHFTADASPLNPRDDALVERMVAKNATKLEEIEAKIKDADENHGESEVRDAKMAKATFLDNMGDKVGPSAEIPRGAVLPACFNRCVCGRPGESPGGVRGVRG
jgi:hypothetical protein